MPIRLGFIGCGHIATTHIRILRSDPRCQIAGVHDLSPERANATGVPVFESAGALIDAVDAVYVTSPNRLHLEHALAALEQRKHVFCEKPMGVTLAEARSIAEGAAKAGTVFQVGHNRRFAPVYQALKAAITSPALGADLKMNRGELENPPWTVDEKITGGFLFETPIHIFDMARFLMGEIVEVTARAESQVYPTLDSFFALFRFASGRTATFRSCAYTGWSFPFERVEVYSKHSTFATEEMDRILLARGLNTPTEIADYRHLPWEQRWGYVEEDRLFLNAIEQGTPPPVNALDGLRAVEIACAIYESARTGAPVSVE